MGCESRFPLRRLALVVVLAACGGGGARQEPPTKQAFHPPAGDLLGLVWNRNSAELTKLDPRTLAPRSARIDVGAGTLIAFSPDKRTLALAGEEGEITLVDLRTLRSRGVVDIGMSGYVSRLSWPPPGMLFAAVGQRFVVVIDPVGRRVYETRQVEGTLIAAAPTKAGLLGLVAPADRIGPLQLVVWGGKGTSAVPLRMVDGWETEQGDDGSEFRSRELVPGLAGSPACTSRVPSSSHGQQHPLRRGRHVDRSSRVAAANQADDDAARRLGGFGGRLSSPGRAGRSEARTREPRVILNADALGRAAPLRPHR
jgi:hypothetical protein